MVSFNAAAVEAVPNPVNAVTSSLEFQATAPFVAVAEEIPVATETLPVAEAVLDA